MFACILTIGLLVPSDPPVPASLIEMRLSFLMDNIHHIKVIDDVIDRLRETAKRSPALSKECERLIQRGLTEQKQLQCEIMKTAIDIINDIRFKRLDYR